MSIIEVSNVTKEYKLGQLKSLKHTVLDTFDRMLGKEVERPRPFKALDNIDFRVEPGEVLGIIGINGAGKSTLLKMLARISVPTSGAIKVSGSVAPLIEVGAGLVGDLSGRENIYINGSILGLSRTTIKKKFDEIVAFAELEEFIDTPIKRYSSGMAVRLGFSIATSVDADILIVDEVLAVGDLAFQRKCFDRMEDMIKKQGKTVLLVSHNIRQVERICSRVILLDQGMVIADGSSSEICNIFLERSDRKINENRATGGRFESSGEVDLVSISIIDESGCETDRVRYRSDVTVSIIFRMHVEFEKPVFGVGIHSTDFVYLSTNQSLDRISEECLAPGLYEVRCLFREFPFLPGSYSLRIGIAAGKMFRTAFYAENVLHFQVIDERTNRAFGANEGFISIDASWLLIKGNAGNVKISV